jgi:hypothetical protein
MDGQRRRWKVLEYLDQRTPTNSEATRYRGAWISPRPRQAEATLVSGPVIVTVEGNAT